MFNILKRPPKAILHFVILFCFGSLSSVLAQNKEITTSNQQWFQYYNQLVLSPKWSIASDAGIRFKDEFDSASQYIFRSGLRYHTKQNLSLTAGFAHLGFYSEGRVQRREYRPYQEAEFKHNFNNLNIAHRGRIEQRFFRSTLEDNNSFNFRFRYRLLFNIPIWNLSAERNQISLTIGDEIFINAGEEIQYNVFDQNRLLIGPSIRLNTLRFTLIYNYQLSRNNRPNQYKQAHIIWLGINHTISLKSVENN